MTTPSLRRQNPAESRPPRTVETAPPATAGSRATVMLRAAKAVTFAVRGPRSGRSYLFSDREATAVLAEDAPALLRSGAVVAA